MTTAELGGGRMGRDTVNLRNIRGCDTERCEIRQGRGDPNFECERHNGTATIVAHHGVTRNTVENLRREGTPCLQEKKG
jgi:hypothetical protein